MNGDIEEQSAQYDLAALNPLLEKASGNNALLDSLNVWLSAQTTKSAGRGRSAENTHRYGVQKLRELILELAVRGKLVPQDPSDEPASVLLKNIAEEKDRLVREGKIKKQKPTPAGTPDADTFSLPMNWKWAFLPEITSYAPGKTPPTKNAKYWGDKDDIPWVSIADMTQYGIVSKTSKTVSRAALEEIFKAEPVEAGAILMSFKLTVGKVSINDIPTFHNEAIISIFPFSGVDRSYLFKVLPMRALAGKSKNAIKGNTLNASSIAQIKIPLPPLAEQHRIVQKVDELMALCDKLEQQQADAVQAHDTLIKVLLDTLTQSDNADDFQQNWRRIAEHFDTLFTTESSIDQLKQKLLQLAIMGKLVPQDPNDEPASVLLEKIAEEKARLVEQGKVKKQKTTNAEASNPESLSLPKGWTVTEFESVIDPQFSISYGVLVPGPEVKDGVPFVRVGDLTLDSPSDLPEKTISKEVDKKFAKTRLMGGEILMCVVGSIGKLGIVPDSWRGANIARAMCRLVPSKFVSKEYILMLLQSSYMRERFGADTRTLAQPTLNVGLIKVASTPIPPLAEQHRIVKKVDELMALCNQLKDRLNQTQTLKQQLADAVVETAITKD